MNRRAVLLLAGPAPVGALAAPVPSSAPAVRRSPCYVRPRKRAAAVARLGVPDVAGERDPVVAVAHFWLISWPCILAARHGWALSGERGGRVPRRRLGGPPGGRGAALSPGGAPASGRLFNA